MNADGLFGTAESPPSHGTWTYLRVAVERGVDRVKGDGLLGADAALTYRSSEPVLVGRRVEVPLGRGNTSSAGIVIQAGGEELLGGYPAHKVKSILRDTGAGLSPKLVELARWISTYYVSPLGMVLSAMLPAAVKKRTGLRLVTLIDRASVEDEVRVLGSAKLTPSVREAWEHVLNAGREGFPIAPESLAGRIGSKTLGPINKLVAIGLLKECEVEDVRERGGVSTQMGIEQADAKGGAAMDAHRPTPTNQQQLVIDGISESLGRFGVHLLRGITGSGKTEVYLRVLERVLEQGGTGLVLVPEISLTPQTAGRFVERFRTAGVAVLHSGLSASQRHREWTRAASGAARVVVGARSAVFAPLENVGLIVVDEEHASDYKQDQLPRYHGRDVAIKRGHMEACPVILGSATPSLESWVNAAGSGVAREEPPRHTGGTPVPPKTPAASAGKYALWELTERAAGGRLPRVEIVDLADERRMRVRMSPPAEKRNAHLHLIGPTLEAAIGETMNAGGQVLLLLNRRGYAAYIACCDTTCGWIMVCDDCDAKMVQHRVIAGQTPPKGVVRCHHCLAQKLMPEKCPTCGQKLIALGHGTQSVEMELAKKFASHLGEPIDNGPDEPPTVPGLLRADGDTMASAKDWFNSLGRFASGEVRVLVGTQMIAKGLDFPNVRLVGVINADTALSVPDFRAAERTFQLVSQVAGRAGRGTHAGRVIVQTFDPQAPAIVHASEHDYVSFVRDELAVRREAALPPMVRMARVVVRDLDLGKAEVHGKKIAEALRAGAKARGMEHRVRIEGPAPAPIARIAGQHRLGIELYSPARMLIQELLAEARAKGLCTSDAHTAVDVDPIAMA
ncbi:MAG: primosomal protein N' [Phycisphaerales bacterium]|nr:primosomal protein N' [Phycisphaerales bacterium]